MAYAKDSGVHFE